MIKPLPFLSCIFLAASALGLQASINVQVSPIRSADPVPAGYTNVFTSKQSDWIEVSKAPFVDYIIPNKSGSNGIFTRKAGGTYIHSTTIDSWTAPKGANNLTNPDLYQVISSWEDGTPVESALEYYGVSWTGWSATAEVELEVRIDLSSDEEITIFHWFNDGWDYSSHATLTGHQFVVRQFDSTGAVIAEETRILPSGGAEDIFGDHRNFYLGEITASRTAPGEYLVLSHRAANIGYKGTAVALLKSDNWGPWTSYLTVTGRSYVDTGMFLGYLDVTEAIANPSSEWVYSYNMDKWIWMDGDTINDNGAWAHIPKVAEPVPVDETSVDVFLLAGQSNMDGHAWTHQISPVPTILSTPQTDILYSYRQWRNSGGSSTLYSMSSLRTAGGRFGPEISLGASLNEGLPGRKIALLKASCGGTNLYYDWNPDSASGLLLYPQSVEFFKEQLLALENAGYTPNICGFFWYQGEGDANKTPERAQAYEGLLTELVARYRQDLGVSDLPAVFVRVYANKPNDHIYRDTVRTAIENVAEADPFAAWIDVDDLTYSDTYIHLDAAGQMTAGERLAEAYFGIIQAQ